VVILAAGKGTRMRSDLPKVLHQVMGRPIIAHVLNAARYLEPARLIVVTGHGADLVEAAAAPFGASFARQDDPRGTGHAVQCAAPALDGHAGPVVILPGDVPLLSPQTLIDLMAAHRVLSARLSVLTVRVADPASYGRVVRDGKGWLERIVEARDASESELAINEINSGVYVASGPDLVESVFGLKPDNDQKEYYLTDVVADFRARGLLAAAVEGPDPLEIQGVNDRLELSVAQSILRRRINESWLLSGVTMADPASTHIEASVRLARDVSLGPGVVLQGTTRIGQGATVGPYCCLRDVEVGPGVSLGAHLDLSCQSIGADGHGVPETPPPVPKKQGGGPGQAPARTRAGRRAAPGASAPEAGTPEKPPRRPSPGKGKS
jgi:bifunctional UDP-N-acetylglucosamine pyrophosphorylase/glucosamine-1-phosphate N-acetyltransferase